MGLGKCEGTSQAALTAQIALSIPPHPKLPRRLMVRLRTLTPSIVVRIHAGHPPYSVAKSDTSSCALWLSHTIIVLQFSAEKFLRFLPVPFCSRQLHATELLHGSALPAVVA